MFFRATVTAAAVLAGLLALSPLATAAPGSGGPFDVNGDGTVRYVALGDSRAAGPGIAPIADAGCARSANNYPSVAARALGIPLTDVTCSAAGIPSITGPQVVSGGTRAPQLDAVAGADIVTINIGGNDLSYLPAESACEALLLRLLDLQPCSETPAAKAADARLATLGSDLDAMLAAVRAAAPQAIIAVGGHNGVFAGYPCLAWPVRPGDAAWMTGLLERFDDELRAAASRAGAVFLDFDELASGHDVCSPQPWYQGVVDGPNAIRLHPNFEGMQAFGRHTAQALTAAAGA